MAELLPNFYWSADTRSWCMTTCAMPGVPWCPPGATFVEGDVADSKRLEEIFSSDTFAGVMHFAALIEAGDSMRKPETYFGNNTAATLGLLQAMLNKNLKKLVFSSTAAVYGEPVSTPILEDAALVPTNPYGESKLLVEQMLSWIHRVHGLRYASLRYFNVAGAIPGRGEAHEPESHIIPLILDVALGRRQSIKIFGQDYPTPTGPAFATTFTSRIWRRRTC